MSDYDAPRDFIINFNKEHNRLMTQTEFLNYFNVGLLEAAGTEYENEGIIRTPKTNGELEAVVIGRISERQKGQTITRNGKKINIVRDSKGRFARRI